MDAVNFLKTLDRICTKIDTDNCTEGLCPIKQFCDHMGMDVSQTSGRERDVVDIVEKWAEEHPVKTRQSEFLRI